MILFLGVPGRARGSLRWRTFEGEGSELRLFSFIFFPRFVAWLPWRFPEDETTREQDSTSREAAAAVLSFCYVCYVLLRRVLVAAELLTSCIFSQPVLGFFLSSCLDLPRVPLASAMKRALEETCPSTSSVVSRTAKGRTCMTPPITGHLRISEGRRFSSPRT